MDRVAMILAAAVLAMMVPGVFLYRAFVLGLRERHPGVWAQLGRPTLFFYGSLDGSRRVHRFVRRRDYEALDDSALARVCNVYRRYVSLYSGTCVAAVVALLLSALGVGIR